MTNSFRMHWPVAAAIAAILLAAACSSGGEKAPPTPTTTPPTVEATPPLTGGMTTTLPEASPTTSIPLTSDRIDLSTTSRTEYYTVTGLTTAEIFASIDQNGPQDDKGVKGSGLTAATWGYRWQPQPVSDGCVIGTMTITLQIVVTLPRHQGEGQLSSQLRSNWRAFVDSVDVHEQTHVDIDEAGARTIRDKMAALMAALKAAPSCDALTRQVDTLWNSEQRAIATAQDQFHAQEDARIASRRAPLQSQIDVNRTRISALAAQIQGLDSSLSKMNSELTNVDNQLEALKSAIDAILAEYPDGNLPSDVYLEHEELRCLYNALAPTFNQLVAQYNSSIAQRNNVADEHDDLVEATNLLVDQFNWTR